MGFLNRDLILCLAAKKKMVVYKWEKNKFIVKVRPRELLYTEIPLIQAIWDQVIEISVSYNSK